MLSAVKGQYTALTEASDMSFCASVAYPVLGIKSFSSIEVPSENAMFIPSTQFSDSI